MKDFSTIVAPLNDLTKKGVEFLWGTTQDIAFDELKKRLISAPLLYFLISISNSKLNVMLVALE